MILSGLKISGYNYIGRTTLSTIATPICWYDWRFGRTDGVVVGGALRVASLADLSPNNFLLEANVGTSNKPMILSDGIGMDDTIGTKNAAIFRKLGTNPKYETLHKGNPFLIMAVIKPIVFSSFVNLLGTQISSTVSSAGLRFRIDGSGGNNRLQLSIHNDAGTGVINVNTGTGTISTGSFYFIAAQYYGSGSGSNNLKIWINNTQYTFTANPTFGTGACPLLAIAHGAGGLASNAFEFSQKFAIAYDLTGKSTAEIDAFRILAINTLKSDLEYSSLVTP
jgi:hypothetical protein